MYLIRRRSYKLVLVGSALFLLINWTEWATVTSIPAVSAQSSGYLAAGGGFTNYSCNPPDCKLVGTHVGVTVRELDIDGSTPDSTYGFGIGHITSSGAKNWATIENVGGTHFKTIGANTIRRTNFRRVCSIDGHVMYGSGVPSPRQRFTSSGSGTLSIQSRPIDKHYAIGLNMLMESACAEQQGTIGDCQNEFLRWECIYDTGYDPERPPSWHTSLPRGAPYDDTAVYMPAGETISEANHGFFSRNGSPPSSDKADLIFRGSENYAYGPLNPVDNCPANCKHYGTLKWVEDSDNHEPWMGGWGYELGWPIMDVYDYSSARWKVCMNDGGPCGEPAPMCSERRVLGWGYYRCQEEINWCWAASIQSTILQQAGVDETQCNIVKTGVGSPTNCSPTAVGWPDRIEWTLEAYGVGVADRSVGPFFDLTFDEIRAEIDRDRPILTVVRWPGTLVFHIVAIVGYECEYQRIYYYNTGHCKTTDPNETIPLRWKSYDDFVSGEWNWYGQLTLD